VTPASRFKRARAGLAIAAGLCAMAAPAKPATACGELVTLPSSDSRSIAYSLAAPNEGAGQHAALLLLAGGGGALGLDDRGCARKLTGNSLVRAQDLFRAQGFFIALVDAPPDYQGPDGLAGFRTDPRHAADLGLVIADVRRRTKLPVFVVGTSRGTISAANAAARLSGGAAPDGVVLTSPITQSKIGGYKAWTAQSVFDLPLADIRTPILVVAHAADTCIRTPPQRAERIIAATNGAREQLVLVTGGPGGNKKLSPLDACQGNAPHGFVGQDAEVTAGIGRFVRGGSY